MLQAYFSHSDYEIRKSRSNESRFGKYFHVERDPNGGACVLHAYIDEVARVKEGYVNEFVRDFLRLVFHEEKEGQANFVMGIVHGAAAGLPELLNYFATNHPQAVVKTEVLGRKSEMETLHMEEFYGRVQNSYHNGTYRAGPLLQFSLVGTVNEEVGGYFPEILEILEDDPFLQMTLPWGELSLLRGINRRYSNDGPIMWTRPGEQVVPAAEMARSPQVKRRRYASLSLDIDQSLMFSPHSNKATGV